MEIEQLEAICQQAIIITKEVGKFIKSERGKVSAEQIEEKDLNSLVSYVDKKAETQLVSKLGQLVAGATFLTEEEVVEQKAGRNRWIIDPLDGTTNFLHQLPCFAVSVALEVEGQIAIGIVYEVNNDECFYAWKGGGAFLNDQPIYVSGTTQLSNSLIATGFPYHDFSLETPYFEVFNHFMKNTRGIRRFGAAAVDLAYVACGRFDAFFEYGLNAWDVAAGILIVKEANGQVCDFAGESNYIFGGEMIATNANLSTEVRNVIMKAFK